MIRLTHFSFVALVLSLSLSGVGCRKKPVHPTPIPGYTALSAPGGESDVNQPIRKGGAPQGNKLNSDGSAGSGRDIAGGSPLKILDPNSPLPHGDLEGFDNRTIDHAMFKGKTVYFEYDRATLRKSEMAKLAAVAEHLKSNPGDALQIDGHCDERGTEEYNRSLGERRALAAREYIVNLGVQADRIRTLSYGEDHPGVDGHDEAAWAKNRRCEFGRVLPASTR